MIPRVGFKTYYIGDIIWWGRIWSEIWSPAPAHSTYFGGALSSQGFALGSADDLWRSLLQCISLSFILVCGEGLRGGGGARVHSNRLGTIPIQFNHVSKTSFGAIAYPSRISSRVSEEFQRVMVYQICLSPRDLWACSFASLAKTIRKNFEAYSSVSSQKRHFIWNGMMFYIADWVNSLHWVTEYPSFYCLDLNEMR